MNPFDKILVPVDFSKHSDAAIDTAMDVAARYDSSIVLMNVLEPLALAFPEDQGWSSGSAVMEEIKADLLKALEQKRDAALARGAKRVTIEQRHGNPAASIKAFADAGNFDLIVMGTLGRTGIAHFFLGSVAERVVRTASCAVLTVHEHSRPFSKILVPTDFSADADAALDAAIDVAARWQASITLVNVFQPMAYTYPTGTGIYTNLPIEHVIKDQLETLEKLQKGAIAKGAKHVEIAHRTGHPATEVCNLARDGGFDLIAMGTHGRSGLSRVFLGAVAERVVRTAPCPVLTIRPRTRTDRR